ncbi:thiol-disulfide oxidoreductase DCC family protein [Poriferisphaera sp. WC338]|uniref:thiol-disulfide oxidoreductase DCC family protein n=1 Tax=Poriferisphaera sp. WC338 TaxID=3425129 RepID=UPI003D81B331
MNSVNEKITVLYDGKCPLCKREIAFLQRMDRKNIITPINISAPDFDPTQFGRTPEELDARIHAFLPDGTYITGMEVFRQLYDRIGLGWTVSWTRLPVVRPIANRAYDLFARNRHFLPGYTHASSCDTGTCTLKPKPTVIKETTPHTNKRVIHPK